MERDLKKVLENQAKQDIEMKKLRTRITKLEKGKDNE
jgi:hypothetical protein